MDDPLRKLQELIDNFSLHERDYKSPNYNEANTRVDFIDPFFELLGWDIQNLKGRAENYREVVREDSIKIAGKPAAPDYSFRIGGQRKFFVEAKKPGVNIYKESAPAYQVRRYGYTAKLPLSVLTDFEEFSIYDTRIKPAHTDSAATARIFYCNYHEYLHNFGFLTTILSKEGIRQGNFDRYVKDNRDKRGTSEVDTEFLKTIEGWRATLARNIALRNASLGIHELNHAVQKIIDRIIFLRIAEDRQIEEYGRMLQCVKEADIYQSLNDIFGAANNAYNSGLFHPEEALRDLQIDDKVLKQILVGLYYPDCPYEFSVFSTEILGNIYEQFLGKTIRLTAGHQAKVEERPEVRKAGGVYYTPQYIVDYIVAQTVGEWLVGTTPEQARTLRVCDPACGSGSFLIGAYRYLLEWHLRYYSDEGRRDRALKDGVLYQVGGGGYALAIQEKRAILCNTIYGVDIDPQAVEVTKLSLLLKLLEGENAESSGALFRYRDHQLLPDLAHNIKCGNSLIGSDYYHNRDMALFGIEDMRKVNAFDWHKEFADIFANRGFDIVVGNPPYVRIQTLNDISKEQVDYYNYKYTNIVAGSYDLYILFIYKGMRILNQNGVLGFINPHKFFQAQMGAKIREYIAVNSGVKKIVDFSTNQIFESATTYTCLLFLTPSHSPHFLYKQFRLGEEPTNLNTINFQTIDSKILSGTTWNFHNADVQRIIDKIYSLNNSFAKITKKIFKGSSSGNDKVFLLKRLQYGESKSLFYSEQLASNVEIENEIVRPFLFGESIRRYEKLATDVFLLYPYQKRNDKVALMDFNYLKTRYPHAFDYLQKNKTTLQKRKTPINGKNYYKFSAARSLIEYDSRKILIPDMLVAIRVGIDIDGKFWHGPAAHSVIFVDELSEHNDLFYLGILNSKLFWFFISNTSTALRGDAYRLTPEFLNNFHFPKIDLSEAEHKSVHDEMVGLVKNYYEMKDRANNARIAEDKKLLCNGCDIIDNKINALVYRLYGLSDDEIEIVEKGAK